MDALAITDPATTLDALAAHFAGMPPVAAMQSRLLGWRDGVLTLGAPLAINVNDKGNAFGGSLCSLMTIAGWGLGFLQLAGAGLDADIYVADSRIRYIKPVYEDLVVDARLETAGAEGAEALDLPGTLRAQGRVGYRVNARTVLADGGSAAVLAARYVAIAR